MNPLATYPRVDALAVEMCGSRVTCNPPPTDTDEDWRVFCPNDVLFNDLAKWLLKNSYQITSVEYEEAGNEGTFLAFRGLINNVNIMLTQDSKWFQRHQAATHVCKTLNLMDKQQRIMVFQAVLYGNIAKG